MDWFYKLPGIQDLEGDEILEPKVLFFSEAISYDSVLREFKQEMFVATPTNVTVKIDLEDSRGAKKSHDFLIEFKCLSNFTVNLESDAKRLAAIAA